MSNKLIKDEPVEKKRFMDNTIIKHLLAHTKGSMRYIPNWYWYLFIIVVSCVIITTVF